MDKPQHASRACTVFVLDQAGKPLMPCTPVRARLLMMRGRAKAVQAKPFTIKLLDRDLENSALREDRLAEANAVFLGEDGYSYLKLFCPFCGTPVATGCRHRVASMDEAYFGWLAPDLAAFLRRFGGFADDEPLDTSNLLPARLYAKFPKIEHFAAAAAADLNKRMPSGPAAVFLGVRNQRRREARSYLFISDDGLGWLRREAQNSQKSQKT